jgi:hypothetical protein
MPSQFPRSARSASPSSSRADATRQINTLESRASGQRGEFVPVAELSVAPTPEGWDVHFATDRTSYSFAIKDTLDACHFAYFSDEVGLIYNVCMANSKFIGSF